MGQSLCTSKLDHHETADETQIASILEEEKIQDNMYNGDSKHDISQTSTTGNMITNNNRTANSINGSSQVMLQSQTQSTIHLGTNVPITEKETSVLRKQLLETENNLKHFSMLSKSRFNNRRLDGLIDELQLPILKEWKKSINFETATPTDDNPDWSYPGCDDESDKENISELCSTVLKPTTIYNPIVIILGIGEYDGMQNLIGMTTDYHNIITTFVKYLRYKVFYKLSDNSTIYSNNPSDLNANYKICWNDDEIDQFVKESRECTQDNKHDSVLFVVSSHGEEDDVILTSECEEYQLLQIFDEFSQSDDFTRIPKLFVFDTCRGIKRPVVGFKELSPKKVNFKGKVYDQQLATLPAQSANVENKLDDNIRDTSQTQTPKVKLSKFQTRGRNNSQNNIQSNIQNNSQKDGQNPIHLKYSNISKVVANPKGYACLDGGTKGGYLIQSLCKVFKDSAFVKQHQWSEIVMAMRDYTQMIVGKVLTQVLEHESTLHRDVKFESMWMRYRQLYQRLLETISKYRNQLSTDRDLLVTTLKMSMSNHIDYPVIGRKSNITINHALLVAVAFDDIKLAKQICRLSSVDPNMCQTVETKQTILMVAINHRNCEMIQQDINGKTALHHIACMNSKSFKMMDNKADESSMLTILNTNNDEWNKFVFDKNGWLWLHYICANNKYELLRFIISHKICSCNELNIKTMEDKPRNPLDIAMQNCSIECVKELLTLDEIKNTINQNQMLLQQA